MIHHVSVGTNNIGRASEFYDPLMSLIGLRLLKRSETALHYGASDIVFSLETPIETVRRFYDTAIANGGADEGAPGIREKYNANYYGAFVRDLDGNKIEAVTYTARESFHL